MTIAYLAIQCHPEDYTHRGTYLFDPVTKEPISPVFREGVGPLLTWCDQNGWRRVPNDPRSPVGVYEKMED